MTQSKTSADTGHTLQERLRALTGCVSAPMIANLLGLSRITVYKKASAGDIPCLRIGGAVRFDPVMIARWLDDNEVSR
jgi:excisionase family DNA binding protein